MTKVKLNHIDLGGDQCQLPVDTNLYILVQELPEIGKKDKIYLVKDDTAPEGNVYNEYSFINGAWESLGQHSSTIDVEVPTKVSQLENDEGFVKSASLGTAAYKNVEDLQGGMTLVKEDVGNAKDVEMYMYSSASNNGNKTFITRNSYTDVVGEIHLIDFYGNVIKSFSDTKQCIIEQEQIVTSLFKITFNTYESYNDSYATKTFLSENPIAYICLGEYSGVLPVIAQVENKSITYNIKEYSRI